MKNKEVKEINKEVPKKNKLRRAIYNARNIIDALKALTAVTGILGIIFVTISIVTGNFFSITTEITTYDFLNNEQLKTIIVVVLAAIYGISLYLSLKNAVTLLDNLLNFGIFNDKTISRFDIVNKYLIIFWAAGFSASLDLNIYLIVIIAIVNLCKHIFIYGKNLEEEISEVI